MNQVKSLIKRFPIVEKIIVSLKRLFVKQEAFQNSEKYWINRYNRNGDSGPGSYNNLAKFKAQTINSFITKNDIDSIIDFGCGDGNQLSYLKVNKYLGLDVSSNALNRCRKKYKSDKSKSFKLHSEYDNQEKYDLGISLDVIFHLIEDEVFENYMKNLFSASQKYVMIYSSNTNEHLGNSPHFKQRVFTEWVEKNILEFDFVEKIPNMFPSAKGKSSHKRSLSDFYFYKRKTS